MNIKQATQSYENWMRSCGPVVERHLQWKHSKMREDPFQFLRGSYYRWAQMWPEICQEYAHAPKVLAIGDLHVDSFGTWRDAEGRLSWGVDDFDEAYPLPYTNDLIRLAASFKIARKLGFMRLKTKTACEIILEGYRQSLDRGGCPIVLAESETDLEKLGIEALKTPKGFWEKLNNRPSIHQPIPGDAKRCLLNALPAKGLKYRIIQREAGTGSLGQQRFVAIAQDHGGDIAREAKRVLPPANLWLRGKIGSHQSFYGRAIDSAVRSRDPFQRISKRWLLRRLSPDSNPIRIEELSGKRDEDILLQAMGSEVANVHLGTSRSAVFVLRDLKRRKKDWLHHAARTMARFTLGEWKEYRV